MRDNLRYWVVRALASLVFFNGVLALFRPLVERFPDRYENFVFLANYDHLTRSLDVFFGVSLIYLSYQLLRGRVLAWWLSLVVSIGLASLNLGASRWVLATAAPVTAIIMLLISKQYFKARSAVERIRNGFVVLIISIALAIAYGAVGFWFMDKRDFGINFSPAQSITQTFRSYFLFGNSNIHPHTRYAHWFLDSLAIMGALSLSYGLFSLFRPIEYFLLTAPAERSKTEDLLRQYSRSSEDFFKLWPHDKSYFFSRDRQAVIAYGVQSGVALAVLDPVGKASSIASVIKEFTSYCSINGWAPIFVYVSDHHTKEYSKQGLNVLKIGEDAIVNLEEFATTTIRNKHFRNIASRFQKAGYSTELHAPPHSSELIHQVSEISKSWMAQPGRKEWNFLAGSFSERYMQMTKLFVVYNQQGEAEAFANLIPSYTEGLATIDLMRYNPNAPKNIMDYLFMKLLLELKDDYKAFNLGLAPLSGLGEADGRPEEKLLDLIYRSNQSFISLQGLRQFKSKFEPKWEPKFVAYQGSAARLPRIAYALSKVMS